MTYIITIAGKDSIYMASDSRLNYYVDKIVEGEKYQEIQAISDGIKKIFFLENLNIGIQFCGIGFFKEGDKKYALSHFIKKLEKRKSNSIEESFKIVFEFFQEISSLGDAGKYVQGVMCGIENKNKKFCFFNTFNNDFKIRIPDKGKPICNQENPPKFSLDETNWKKEINEVIKEKSKEKCWSIGGEITLLKIEKDSFKFLSEFEEKFDSFENIPWKVFKNPILEKYSL